MLSVPKSWPSDRANGGTANCDYCGVRWPRTKLVRDGNGYLVCPDEGRGLDRYTLDSMNADAARTHLRAGPVDAVQEPDLPDDPHIIFGERLLGWYLSDGADGPSDDRVTRLADFSGNHNHALFVSTGSVGRLLRQSVNHHAAVRGFGGTIPTLTLPQPPLVGRVAFWMVARRAIAGSVDTVTTSGGYFELTTTSGTLIMRHGGVTLATGFTIGQLIWQRSLALWSVDSDGYITVGTDKRSATPIPPVASATQPPSLLFNGFEVAECGWISEPTDAELLRLNAYHAETFGKVVIG